MTTFLLVKVLTCFFTQFTITGTIRRWTLSGFALFISVKSWANRWRNPYTEAVNWSHWTPINFLTVDSSVKDYNLRMALPMAIVWILKIHWLTYGMASILWNFGLLCIPRFGWSLITSVLTWTNCKSSSIAVNHLINMV